MRVVSIVREKRRSKIESVRSVGYYLCQGKRFGCLISVHRVKRNVFAFSLVRDRIRNFSVVRTTNGKLA